MMIFTLWRGQPPSAISMSQYHSPDDAKILILPPSQPRPPMTMIANVVFRVRVQLNWASQRIKERYSLNQPQLWSHQFCPN